MGKQGGGVQMENRRMGSVKKDRWNIRMDVNDQFECRRNGSKEIEGWMSERSVFLGHV